MRRKTEPVNSCDFFLNTDIKKYTQRRNLGYLRGKAAFAPLSYGRRSVKAHRTLCFLRSVREVASSRACGRCLKTRGRVRKAGLITVFTEEVWVVPGMQFRVAMTGSETNHRGTEDI